MRRVIVFALLALCAIAHADDDPTRPSYRAVIDRVDFEPSAITGYRLRVYLSALAIDGQQLDLTDPKSIKLYVGGGAKQVPYALGRWDQAGGELAVVLVVQATADFADALPTITESLDRDILGALPDKTTQAAVLTYGEATGTGKLAPVKQLRGKLGAIASDGTAGDPALLDALDRALMLLKRAKTDPEGRPLRKLVIVVGDGRDRSGDKDRATKLAQRAAREGVRIHSIAYSPNDVRRPLLYLGELSRKSLGTFRWPGRGHHPTPESWSDTMKQLRDEIAKQYVITYFVSADDEVAGKKLSIATVGRTETRSNETKVPGDPSCNGTACEAGYCAADACVVPKHGGGGGFLKTLLWIAGLAVGGVFVLGLIGWAMTKRQEQAGVPKAPRAPKPARSMSGAPVMPQMPGLLPNGRPIPALLIQNGPRAGERHLMKHGFLIGKQPGCDLQIEDGYTSSQHAQIAMDGAGNCQLFDRGSTNGTFVNGVRVNQLALSHGMVVRIGSTELVFLAQ